MQNTHPENYHVIATQQFDRRKVIPKSFSVRVNNKERVVQVLKCIDPYFGLVWNNRKTYECRDGRDRNYSESDILLLFEPQTYLMIVSQVSHIMRDFDGLSEGWEILNLKDKLNMLNTLDDIHHFNVVQDYFFLLGVPNPDVVCLNSSF